MFCYQCEQHTPGKCGVAQGVCGKTEETAELLDLLLHATKGVARYAVAARKLGAGDRQVDRFVMDALFTTVTNVNFDPAPTRTKPASCRRGARPGPNPLPGRLH